MSKLYKKIIGHWSLVVQCSFLFFASSASAQINANFSASPLTGCAPLVVCFNDLSTGNPTSWTWNLGNGASIPTTQPNPCTVYTTPGTYTVILTASNGSNTDTEIKINYITVYNPPQTNFNMNNDTACIGEPVIFSDATVLSAGGAPIGNWLWDFGDGYTLNATNDTVTHSYSSSGTYPVSMIATDTNGCGGTMVVKNIVIVPKPVPSFSATPTFSCLPPLTVAFTNTSTSIGTTTYIWHFGDGNSSVSASPSYTYTASGTYNVTLIINQNGCIDSVTLNNYITIQNIAASFIATPTVVCTGEIITFNNTSVPTATTASWNFGDAGTSTVISPTHTYTSAGTFTVTLISGDANSCVDTTTGIVTVNQTPVANFSADTMVACSVPFTVTFTNSSTGGTNYSWNFGDGSANSTQTNPSHTYTASGTYTVSLIVTNSSGPCSDTIVMPNYIVIAPPLASFTHMPDSGCVPLTVNFMSTSTSQIDPISTYSWSFGDGGTSTAINPSHTYTATGVYSVTLIIQTVNGCSDTIICPGCIKVGTPPVADFGILQDTVCYGLPVNFSDSSTGATGWHWDFGDGGQSILQNPIYVYGDTGTYDVILIAYNNGCADTSLIKNVVILPPKALFTYQLSCTNYYTVLLISTSEGADSLFWNFGDGSQDSLNNDTISHTYPIRGPFTVTLTAYNYSSGCNNTITGSFTIAEPIASYTVTNTIGCYPFTVNFTSTSQDANSVWWNFGDTATILDTSIVTTPAYTYTATAQYPVTFIITDVNGCKDTLIDTLGALGPYPYFYADTLTGCRPLPVTFVDTSTSDSLLVQWIWNFGDGTIDTTNNDSIIHIYTTPGTYAVTMTVTDKNGCVKTITINNYIQPTFPYPSFTVDTFACKGDVLTYDASATSVVGGTYYWNYGDGNLDTTNNPTITHAYTNDGLYIVTLTVTDVNGCDSTITDTVRILKPTANFSWSIASVTCGNMLVTFHDSSTGFVTSSYWDFGNGGTATTSIDSVSAIYSQGGIYSVTLIVTNAGGCKDTLKLDSIIVVPFPAGSFSFTPTTGCNPLTVTFNANGINTIDYIWDFGDGTVVTNGDSIIHTYTSPGTFNPILLLQDTLPNGTPCVTPVYPPNPVIVTNVVNNSILVNGIPTSVITVPQDSIIAANVSYSGGTPPYTFNWSPDTGLNCDTCSSVFIVGTGDTISYMFTIYDVNGCVGYDSILILSEPCLEEKLIPNVFTPNADGLNDVFYIPGVCPGENYSLQIFDRWGTLMFSTTLRNNGWDGRNNSGMEASNGTYYFIVHIDDPHGIQPNKLFKGFVELLR